MIIGLVLIALIVVLAFAVMGMYNGLVRGRNDVEEAFSTMDVFLKKRHDMIPNLVATVKAYAKHEAETLEKVIQARNETAPMAQRIEQEKEISASIRNLMVRCEAYPELKANTNFLHLQDQLVSIEGDIEKSRRYYNGTARQQNNRVQTVPTNIIANMFGFEKVPYFQVDSPADRQNVDVAASFGV